MISVDAAAVEGPTRLIHPRTIGEPWPEGGRIQALVDADGQFHLDLVVDGSAPMRVIVDPLEPDAPSFARTPSFRIFYPEKTVPSRTLAFLRAVAKLIEANDRAGTAPLPTTSPPGTTLVARKSEGEADGGPLLRIRVPFDKGHLEKRVEALVASASPLPDELEVIVTNPCAMGCVFCPQGDLKLVGRKSPFDHDDELDQIRHQIEQNRALGVLRLKINGNDPLMHPHLDELIRLGKENGFREILLQTPGLRLCDEALARRVVAAGVTGVDMPFYSHREDLFSAITGIEGSKQQADAAVRNLLRLGLKPSLHGIAIASTLPELGDTVRYIRESFDLPFTVHHYVPHHIDQSKHRYMPSYTLVAPAIEANPEAFAHSADFPLCLHESLRSGSRPPGVRSLNLYQEALPYESLDSTRWRPTFRQLHPPLCEGCSVRERCGGTYQSYLDRYGTEGLSPVL